MNYRKTWKELGKRISPYATYFGQWGGPGDGKFWKRKMHKARRRAWKDEYLRGRTHFRGMGVEGEVNWKGW